MEREEETRKIINCAFKVFNVMGHGFLESVYEKCMVIELQKASLKVEAQKEISVFYEDVEVGKFFADLLVEDDIVVEIKAVRQLAIAHEVQLVNYLTATLKPLGLLINFGPHGVEVKRKVRVLNDES